MDVLPVEQCQKDKVVMTAPIHVILADDHAVVRRGIRDFLTEAGDIVVVAEADSGIHAYNLVIQHQPDVVLLDVQMPDGNGIEVTKRLRSEGMTLGILILTAFDDPPYIKAAIEAGANGYVLKSSEADEIIEGVHAAHEGKTILDAHLLGKLAETLTAETNAHLLTDRESDILRLAAKGLTNKAIGFQLSISDRTVQGHLANIYGKLSVSSRTEAVTKAVSMGLIEVSHS
jgi:DNA-binding NarL/FixJ family response regulator